MRMRLFAGLAVVVMSAACLWTRLEIMEQRERIASLEDDLSHVHEIVPGMIRAELQAHEERMMAFLRRSR